VVVDKNFRSVLRHTDRAGVMVKGQVALESVSSSLLDNPAQLSTLLGV
jgi:branched-chain amino acid transport system ATP-binding protein